MKISNLLLFIVILASVGCAKTHKYYIRDGKMSRYIDQVNMKEETTLNDYELYEKRCVEILLGGHYINSGNKLVVLIRKWNPGKLFVIDDEYYEKLTIEIEEYIIGKPIDVASKGVGLFYSKGGSSWISFCSGVFSSDGRGYITVLKANNNKLVIKIDISLVPISARNQKKLNEININDQYKLKEISRNELTPWLGQPNPPDYTGGYP